MFNTPRRPLEYNDEGSSWEDLRTVPNVKKSEREAQARLQQIGKKGDDKFVVNKDGVHHDLPRQSPSGTIKDGIFRRMAGLPPKKIK